MLVFFSTSSKILNEIFSYLRLKEIKNIRLISKTFKDAAHEQLNRKSCLVLKNVTDKLGLQIFKHLHPKCLEIRSKLFGDAVTQNYCDEFRKRLESIEEVTLALLINHANVLKTVLNEMPGLRVLKIPNHKNPINIIEASKLRFRLLNFTNLDHLEVGSIKCFIFKLFNFQFLIDFSLYN